MVYDDFETFVVSQDLPCGIGTAVGQHSWFVYGLEHAAHRRSGRPRAAHKSRQHADPHPTPGGYRRALQRILDVLTPKCAAGQPLRLVTDDHPAYRSALRRSLHRRRVDHRVFANPKKRPSPEARRRDREMFPVDQLHMLLRHSLAHHRRETIAFGRRLNALLERGFLAAVWRNWVKGRSERKPDPSTPAMRLGLARHPWSWSRVFAQRLFPWREHVPSPWMSIYRRELITPEIGINCRHARLRAF